MRINSQKIIRLLEELAPQEYAESWDSVGLQLGNRDTAIDKVMVALEVTAAVAAEAEEKSVDLLVVHHPLIFRPMKEITEHQPLGKIIRRLIKADIHVYVAHTNLDIAWGGLNDTLADILDLEQVEILHLSQEQPSGERPIGLGRTGILPEPLSLKALAEGIKKSLNAPQVRFVGKPDQIIRKVGLCTGAGSDLISEARKAGCEVLITGDVKYHEAREAEVMGIAVIDAGHFETEKTAVTALAQWLRQKIDEKEYEVTVIESEILENPFSFT